MAYPALVQRSVRILLIASTLAISTSAHALTVLTARKVARFDGSASRTPVAIVQVSGDAGLATLTDPRCPAESSIEFGYASQSQERTDQGEARLPCEHWRVTRTGFRYHDPTGAAGGVRDIVYEVGRLRILAQGPELEAITGPVIYVENFLRIGEERYLIRFYDFVRNDPNVIVTRRPSPDAAAGEAAFWQTLLGWRPDTERPLDLLRNAVRQHPSDGRSQFYLGAFHVYLSASGPPGQSSLDHMAAAQDPLDQAVELLPHDSVPKAFRGLTSYLNGFYRSDPLQETIGRVQMEQANAENLFFNKAVALFILPEFISGASAGYARYLGWLDDVKTLSTSDPRAYPNVFSSRLAPHAAEGATLMFGDVAAKGGRLADAESWYRISLSLGASSGFPFQAIVQQRLAVVQERLASHRDAPNPSTDSVIGVQGVSDCTLCHFGAP